MQRFRSAKTLQKFSLSSRSGPQPFQSGTSSRRPRSLQRKTLGRDSALVAYAALGNAPIPVSALALIFKRISVRGFFLSDPEHAPKIRPAVIEAAELLRSGRLHAPVAATYPLSAIKDAVAHVKRGGKVLLDVAVN